MFLELEKQLKIITSKAQEVFPYDELVEKLKKSIEENRPLKVKLGIDPTGSELHIGHAVPLRKLKDFQDLGHEIYLIIGTFTAKIGDPTGKSETRKMLNDNEIAKNLEKYLEQASKILNIDKVKVLYNGDWLSKLNLENLINLLSHFSVAQMISREDFSNRLKSNIPISLVEFLYPIMQAYDSVHINADVELGGSDQRFNLLRGRDLQKAFHQEPQVCLIFPILEGLSGKDKMSKSLHNFVSITDDSHNMFGKIMSIPDNLISHYFKLATNLSLEELEKLEKEIKEKPFELKKKLAQEIVKLYHNEEESLKSKEYFEKVFSKHEIPEDIREVNLKGEINIIELIVQENHVSKSEARRLLKSGAIKINEEKIEHEINIKPENQVIKIGKKNIFRIKND